MRTLEITEAYMLLQSINVAALGAERQVEFVRCLIELEQRARAHEQERIKLLAMNKVEHDDSGRTLRNTAEQRAAFASFMQAYEIVSSAEVEICNRLSPDTITTIAIGQTTLSGAQLAALYKLERR